MDITKTKTEHTNEVCSIYESAVNYFRQNNIDQWQKGYPCLESLLQDMARGESYVVLQENTVVATFMLSLQKEPTYSAIYEGAWQGTDDYGVIHRAAVSPAYKGRGTLGLIMAFAAQSCKAAKKDFLRCDTHKQNLSMQKALLKNEFTYSGIIYLDNQKQDPRLVYEKPLL